MSQGVVHLGPEREETPLIDRNIHRVVAVEHGPTFTGRGRSRRVFDYFVRIWYVSTEGVRGFTGERAEVVRFDTEAEAAAFAAAIAEEIRREETR